jgi:hypothetical protein
VVEQVRDDGEEDRAAAFEGAVGDGAGEVSLAAAVGPDEDEPALRVVGVAAGSLESGFEGEALLFAEAGMRVSKAENWNAASRSRDMPPTSR